VEEDGWSLSDEQDFSVALQSGQSSQIGQAKRGPESPPSFSQSIGSPFTSQTTCRPHLHFQIGVSVMPSPSCYCGVPKIVEPDGQEWCPACQSPAILTKNCTVPTEGSGRIVRSKTGRYTLVSSDGTEVQVGSYPSPD
jgi:hypothetical protein